MIGTLVIPRPFDIDAFLSTLAGQRGRHIELVPTQLGAHQPCGMLICTDEVDYIYLAENATPLHAQHIAMHEAAHLAFGHRDQRRNNDDQALSPQDRAEALSLLLPNLSPSLVRRILGRTVYEDEQEREAELFASLVLAEAYRPGPTLPDPRPEVSGGIGLLQSAFDVPQHAPPPNVT